MRSRAHKDMGADAGWTASDRDLLLRFDEDSDFAVEQLMRIQDRDTPSLTIPHVANVAQRKLRSIRDRIKAFNLKRSRVLHQQDPSYPVSENPVRMVLGKCRRGGISRELTSQGYVRANFGTDFKALVMAHRGDNATNVATYVSESYRKWPEEYAHFRTRPDRFDPSKEISFPSGSRIVVQTAGGKGSSKSYQFDWYHFSEAAYFDDYSEVADALAAAPPHAWVFEESTANGPSGGFYKRWQQALDIDTLEWAWEHRGEDKAEALLDGWNGFIRYFFSWLEDPGYRTPVRDAERAYIESTLDEYERILVAKHGATIEQIKWRRERIKLIGSLGENKTGLTDEQYFMVMFPTTPDEMWQSAGNLIFDQPILSRALTEASGTEPAAYFRIEADRSPEVTLKHSANLIVHEPPVPGAMYVLGADVGKGVASGDWSVGMVFDRTDGNTAREVAMLRCKPNAVDFASMLAILGSWYNEAFIVCEINGPGHATVGHLVHILHYANLYREHAQVRVGAEIKNSFEAGYSTVGGKKDSLIQKARRGILDGTLELRSAVAIQEFLAYKRREKGDYGAPDGEYDDCVMAACFGYFGHTDIYSAPVTARAIEERRTKTIAEQLQDDATEGARAAREGYWGEIKRELSVKEKEVKKAAERERVAARRAMRRGGAFKVGGLQH